MELGGYITSWLMDVAALSLNPPLAGDETPNQNRPVLNPKQKKTEFLLRYALLFFDTNIRKW